MQKSVVNLLVFPVDIWDIFVILTKIAILFSVLRILIFYHFFAVVTSFLTEELSVETIQYKEEFVLEEFNRYYISFLDYHAPQNHRPVIHTHDYYEIILVSSGKGLHWCNTVETELNLGDMVLVRPRDIHCCRALSEEFCLINIIIPNQLFQELARYLGSSFRIERLLCGEPTCVHISVNELMQLEGKIMQLLLMNKIARDKMDFHFRAFLIDTFVSCFSEAPSVSKNEIPPWLQDLFYQMLLHKNFKEGLPAMYRLSHVSREYLTRMCRQHLGQTPSELINALRLEYAASELINTTIPVLDISQNAGFNNLSHFYHLFRECYGMSPLQFRKYSLRKTLPDRELNKETG